MTGSILIIRALLVYISSEISNIRFEIKELKSSTNTISE